MIMTIITVPKMAGNTPPSVFDSRGSSDTNSQTLADVVRGLGRRRPSRSGSTRRRPGRAGSSFSLPPSAATTTLAVCRARSSASRASCVLVARLRAPPARARSALDLRARRSRPRSSSVRSRSRICSCAWLMAPIVAASRCAGSPRRTRAASGRRRRQLGPTSACVRSPRLVRRSRTSVMVPISSPHSVRSTTATSGGYSRRAICALVDPDGSRRRRGRGWRPSA